MSTLLGVDDTDSRERGMCTTYVGSTIRRRLEEAGVSVAEIRLIRCNPAVEYKTRGNAAVALATAGPPETVREIASEAVEELAETADPRTHPGIVVAPHGTEAVPDPVATIAMRVPREHCTIGEATEIGTAAGYELETWGTGRGVIGALGAVGSFAVIEEPTYEAIAYRERERWGTPRDVNVESVFDVADAHYPTIWDTVDRVEGEAVCVPNTPGPVLYGIRGDDPDAVQAAARDIDSEPIADLTCFVTNQGTDAHLVSAPADELDDGHSYRTDLVVADSPATREGGHVFVPVRSPDDTAATIDQIAAFEPTKRFRHRVRDLHPGDRITACGEVSQGTLKLEKVALRDAVTTRERPPVCPDCNRRMESAGAGQGYRCRDCDIQAAKPAQEPLERELEQGWYEVPPVARRHIAKPLVRGGFDAPVHPER